MPTHASSEIMNNIIDTRGLICPLPVLKLAKVLRETSAGGLITLWADDPVAIIDVAHFCTETGHRLVSQSDAGDYQIYVVERT